MELLKNCLVINLKNNVERMERVTKELKKINIECERFDAINNEQGIVGCCMSHIECLKLAQKKNLSQIMIWEDDSIFVEEDITNFSDSIIEFSNKIKKWDVLLLSGVTFRPYKEINRQFIQIYNTQCANAYIVKNHYYQTLINLFSISLKYLIHTKNREFSHDHIWKYLQKKDKWYKIIPNYIVQNPGYSDIEKKIVDYTEDFSLNDRYGCDLTEYQSDTIKKELKNNQECPIPKKIFQTWEVKENEMTEEMQKIVNTWKQFNPNYKYHFYDKNDRELFIKNNFSKQIYEAYCRIIPGAYKADLWRYCVLYKYGGIYVDIDTICMNSIDKFLFYQLEFVGLVDFNSNILEGNHNLANGFIASIPNSKILENCINIIVYQVENNIIPHSRLNFSGPGVLGRALNVYLNLPEYNSFIDKEGLQNNLYLLKFEKETEYVKNLAGDILFQNKNGNNIIQEAYNKEIKNIKNHICWLSSITLQPKIALFNGFACHYEMIGYFIEYCVYKNILLDIYTETVDNMDWLKFYLLAFPKNSFKLKKIQDYKHNNNYTKVILLTDDDFSFKNEWINEKVICIDHIDKIRRDYIDVHIGTRYYVNRPNLDWALQVYKLINVQQKIKISKDNIVIIGSNIRYFKPEDITKIKNFEKYNFIFIDRNIHNYLDFVFKTLDNVKVYNNISTITMIELLKESKYILLTDIVSKRTESISASVSLALNCLCTMIIPKGVNKYYNFKSAIEYEDMIDIIEPNYQKLEEDLDYHIKHKYEVFDKYIKY
jgi:mannosyltransferase OCH1-like enzyme